MGQPGFVSPRERGFTLIEITIVLVIAGLIAVAGISVLTTLLKATRARTTNANAEAVKAALQRYVARTSRLPCPAVAGPAPTGIEDSSVGCTATVVGATQMARGVVPWLTLGLPPEQADDGNYRRFTYHVAIVATQTLPTNVFGMRGLMPIHSAVPVQLGLTPAGNQLNSCSNTAAPPPGGDDLNACNLRAVVVLLSHGENGYGAYLASGQQQPAPTSPAEIENTNADIAFVSAVPSTAGATEFDDIVFAFSPDDLLEPMAQQGAFKSAQVVTQENLRTALTYVTNYIVSNATSGSPSLATIPPISGASPALPVLPLDGWGTQIDYGTGHATENLCVLADPVVAFNVTSRGVDQQPGVYSRTGRSDDIGISITVGQLRALVNMRSGISC